MVGKPFLIRLRKGCRWGNYPTHIGRPMRAAVGNAWRRRACAALTVGWRRQSHFHDPAVSPRCLPGRQRQAPAVFHRHRFRHYPTISSARPLDICWIAADRQPAAQPTERIVSQFAGIYREWAPHASLRGHVRCLWINDLSGSRSERLQVVPDGCVDIVWTGETLCIAGPDTRPMFPNDFVVFPGLPAFP